MKVHTIKNKLLFGLLEQNSYLIESKNCCVLIDPTCSKSEIKKITNKPIKAIFITHGHFDHIFNLNEYENIKIYGSKFLKDIVCDNELNVCNHFKIRKSFKLNNFFVVNDNDEVFIDDDIKVTCYETAGHSSDGMSFLIEKNLFVGDTLFCNSIGRTDFLNSSLEEMIKSLKKINALDFKMLYSGHGRNSTREEQYINIKYWLDKIS